MDDLLLHPHYQTPALSDMSGRQTCSQNLLLIEDNLGDVFLIKDMLWSRTEPSKFGLTHANSLAVAFEYLEKNCFDAVLLDLGLPDAQGMDTLLRLQEKAPDIPVVVLTDLDDDALAAQLIQRGAQAYLVKGQISQSWLRSTITLAIAGSQRVAVQYQHEQQLEQSNQALREHIRACEDELERLRERIQMLSAIASTDGLTGIPNRYRFEEYFEREWRQACRSQTPLSLVMIDLDFFKQFNDGYGHLQGDVCLRQVAKSLRELLNRPMDLIARYGGEEFVVVLPETSLQGAVKVATNLGLGIKTLAIRHPNSSISRWVTASFGVASVIPSMSEVPSDLVSQADRALYGAKENGRDRIAYFHATAMITQPIG